MEISNPRRILAVGGPDSGVLTFLKDLTGSAPPPIHGDNSTAGLSHSWTVKTSYYQVELPIWVDEIHNVDEWRAEFVKPEAKEVVTALGAWVYCFKKPADEEALVTVEATVKAISQVVERACGYGWDGVCLAVAMPQSATPRLARAADEWDDVCREHGFEYVDAEATGRNEYGEPVGMARVKEALEANDWTGGGGEDADLDGLDGLDGYDDDDDDGDGEAFNSTFAAEEAEMGLELMGMKTAVHGGEEASAAVGLDGHGDQAAQVDELERMMSKMQAIRDMGADMPEEQRKRFAAKAVGDIMKSL